MAGTCYNQTARLEDLLFQCKPMRFRQPRINLKKVHMQAPVVRQFADSLPWHVCSAPDRLEQSVD